MHIGFIGFGEAGRAFQESLAAIGGDFWLCRHRHSARLRRLGW